MASSSTTTPKPDITLYFLQASRSIRIAWVLEELGLEYESVFFPRENNKAPLDFGERSGNKLKKAPALRDGALVVSESGAITEYLLETYDSSSSLLGGPPTAPNAAARNRIRTFIHAAEGTFMVHALAITYARWSAPPSVTADSLREMEKGLAINVGKDLDWLEGELEGRRFLGGGKVSAADTMILFSIQFIFARDLIGGRKISEWKNIERWVDECENTESYKNAVRKTGHQL